MKNNRLCLAFILLASVLMTSGCLFSRRVVTAREQANITLETLKDYRDRTIDEDKEQKEYQNALVRHLLELGRENIEERYVGNQRRATMELMGELLFEDNYTNVDKITLFLEAAATDQLSRIKESDDFHRNRRTDLMSQIAKVEIQLKDLERARAQLVYLARRDTLIEQALLFRQFVEETNGMIEAAREQQK